MHKLNTTEVGYQRFTTPVICHFRKRRFGMSLLQLHMKASFIGVV
jgi:hypothetical protein